MKKLFQAKRGSSIELESLFNNYALNSAHLEELGREIDQVFSAGSNLEHPSKDAQKDILVMAEMLYLSSLACINGRTVNHEAIDAMAKGSYRLAGDVLAKFNASECFGDLSFYEALVDHDSIDTENLDFFEHDNEE